MAFDIGSAIGHIILNTDSWNSGMQSMTKGMLKANIIFAGLEKAVALVSDAIEKGTEAFLESERVSAQLSQTLKSTGYAAGLTKKEIIDMAGELQQLTRFEDDAIISAQNLLLTFTKIGKDIFPQATEIILDMSQALGQDLKSSAIQVGKALQDPVLGVTALRRVGVNFSEDQQKVIKNLVETGRQAEAQAMILKELQIEFGGSARAARDTFGGALKNLENNTGDFYESIGEVVAIVGRDFVESMSQGVKSVNDFIKSEEGFKSILQIVSTISAGFEVAKNIFFDFGNVIKNVVTKNTEDVKNSFDKLTNGIKISINPFQVLAGITKTLGIGFSIVGSVIKTIAVGLIDLITLAKEIGGSLAALAIALADFTNTEKWENFNKQVDITGKSLDTLGKNLASNVTDVVATTINGFKDFTTEVEIDAKKYENVWNTTTKKITDKLIENKRKETENNALLNKQQTENREDELAKQLEAEEEATKKRKELQKDWAKISDDLERQTTEGKKRQINEQRDAFIAGGIEAAEVNAWADGEIKKADDDAAKNKIEEFQKAYDQWVGFANEAVSGLQSIFSSYYENQLTAEDADYKSKKENIEKTITDETEKTNALEQLESQHNAKQAQIKREQWQTNKAFAIGQAVMDTANSVLRTFFNFGGWPFGIIPAAIMAGIGAVQIGMIASQPMPAFAAGGIATSGPAIVGERGPEIINIGSTSRIIPADETANILSQERGGININFNGPINKDIDVDRVLQIAGSQYRSKLRGTI